MQRYFPPLQFCALDYVSHANQTQVQTGSFILRLLSFPKYEGLYAPSLLPSLEEKAPAFYKWANAVVKENSVNYIYDEEKVATRTKARFAQFAAAAAAAAAK